MATKTYRNILRHRNADRDVIFLSATVFYAEDDYTVGHKFRLQTNYEPDREAYEKFMELVDAEGLTISEAPPSSPSVSPHLNSEEPTE